MTDELRAKFEAWWQRLLQTPGSASYNSQMPAEGDYRGIALLAYQAAYAILLREREVAKDCAMHDDPRAESSDAEEIAQWLYANGYHVAAYTIRSQLEVRNNRIRELEAAAPKPEKEE